MIAFASVRVVVVHVDQWRAPNAKRDSASRVQIAAQTILHRHRAQTSAESIDAARVNPRACRDTGRRSLATVDVTLGAGEFGTLDSVDPVEEVLVKIDRLTAQERRVVRDGAAGTRCPPVVVASRVRLRRRC